MRWAQELQLSLSPSLSLPLSLSLSLSLSLCTTTYSHQPTDMSYEVSSYIHFPPADRSYITRQRTFIEQSIVQYRKDNASTSLKINKYKETHPTEFAGLFVALHVEAAVLVVEGCLAPRTADGHNFFGTKR